MPVLDDPAARDRREAVTRLILCSGKVYVDLTAGQEEAAEQIAIVRVEQLAPFQNTALKAVLAGYPNLAEVLWVQEEPKNMGGWSYMEPRLRDLLAQLERNVPVRYVGRPERASPAEGSAERHAAEQARIVAAAFADAPAVGDRGAATNGARAGKREPAAARSRR